MARFNKTSGKSTKINGLEEDIGRETETFRESSEAKSFIGSTTEPTLARLAKRMERQAKALKVNSEKILHTLSKIEYNAKALNKEIDKLRDL